MTCNGTTRRTKTVEVNNAVEYDTKGNTFICGVDQFLDRFFTTGDEGLFQGFLNQLRHDGFFDESGWTLLPKHPGYAESHYYAPFADTANAIRQLIPDELLGLNSFWVNRHITTPKSVTPDAAGNCPDISNYIGAKDEYERVKKEAYKEQEELDTAEDEPNKGKRNFNGVQVNLKSTKKLSQKMLKFLAVTWLRTNGPVEIKNVNTMNREDAKETFIQLGGYKRQILREQQDRRYVLGIILFHRSISLWYCDRSGLLGTNEWIDIDKEPLKFIRVIANFNMLSPFQLGWDPTMKWYRGIKLDPVYSHDAELKTEDIPIARDDIKWHISLEVLDDQKVPCTRTFVTIKSLSVSRVEVMCGRATLVWLALDVENKKMAVIKQSWRPETSMSENDFYKEAGDSPYIPKVQLSWDSADSRTTKFRGTLHCISLEEYLWTMNSTQSGSVSEAADSSIHIRLSANGFLAALACPSSKATRPIARILNRIIFADYGWPIKYFADRRELLSVVMDTLNGYEHLWHKGIAHRDISAGNVMISINRALLEATDTPDTEVPVCGRIIDLDHSKFDKGYKMEHFSVVPAQADVRNACDLMLSTTPLPLPSKEVFSLLLSQLGDALCIMPYYRALVSSFPHLLTKDSHNGRPARIRADQVGIYIDEQTTLPPTFDSHPQASFRSGTVPFMSHELVDSPQSPPTHLAIHDMESLFWVLVFICLTRSGPGGQRRDELLNPFKINQTSDEIAVSRLLVCFFDGDPALLASNKKELFANPSHLDEYVLPYFHSHFNCLKDLVRSWWRTLTLAFRFRSGFEFSYPVVAFKHAVRESMKQLPRTVVEIDETAPASLAERERRRAEIQLVREAIADLGGQNVASRVEGDCERTLWDSSPRRSSTNELPQRYTDGSPPDLSTPKKHKGELLGSDSASKP